MTPIDLADIALTEVLKMNQELYPKGKEGDLWRRVLSDMVDLGLARRIAQRLDREYRRAEAQAE